MHDELIVEAPEAEAETAARILKEEMEGCVHFAVPLDTDVRQGKVVAGSALRRVLSSPNANICLIVNLQRNESNHDHSGNRIHL